MAAKKKTTTKKTATKKTATKPAAREAMASTAHRAAQAFADWREDARSSGGGSGTPFFKFVSGHNKFRLFYDEEGYPDRPGFVRIRAHDGRGTAGRYTSAVDMDWALAARDEVGRRRKDRLLSKFSKDDLRLWQQFGDPANRLMKALGDIPESYKGRYRPYSGDKLIFLVYQDGMLKIAERPGKMADQIFGIEEDYPDLLHPKKGNVVRITVTEGKRRSYSDLIATPKVEAVDLEGAEPPDLWESVRRKVLGYESKVAFVYRSYGDLLKLTRLTAEDFGVEVEEDEDDDVEADEEDDEA